MCWCLLGNSHYTDKLFILGYAIIRQKDIGFVGVFYLFQSSLYFFYDWLPLRVFW